MLLWRLGTRKTKVNRTFELLAVLSGLKSFVSDSGISCLLQHPINCCRIACKLKNKEKCQTLLFLIRIRY